MPGASDPLSGIIESDRRCRGCGYPLRGLQRDGVCPECAMPIRAPKWIDDPMTRVPAGEIRPRRLGAWIAVISLVLMVGSVGVEASGVWRAGVALSLFPVIACGWVAGIVLLTRSSHLPQAAVHGFSAYGRLRRWARWLQPAWVVGGALAALVRLSVLGPGALPPLAACFVVALIGLVLVAIACERLAEWVRDDAAQKLFGAFAWGLPFAAVVAAGGGLLFRTLAPLVIIAALLMALAALAVFPVALLQLTRSLTYAVVHAEDHFDLEERREQQRRRDAEAAAARARAADRPVQSPP